MKTATFHKGGIHPPENKLTANKPIEEIAVPDQLAITLSQCIGTPSKAIVKDGDEVTRGQLIAEAGGFVSCTLHSPVNGTVKKIESIRNPQGKWQDAIILIPDKEIPLKDNFRELLPEEFPEARGRLEEPYIRQMSRW